MNWLLPINSTSAQKLLTTYPIFFSSGKLFADGYHFSRWQNFFSTLSWLRAIDASAKERLIWFGRLLGKQGLKKATFITIAQCCERYLQHVYPQVWQAQIRARQKGGFSYDQQFIRLLEIAQLLQHFKPKCVLELGSGASTAMFAHHLQDAKRLLTIEESADWIHHTKHALENLANFVNWQLVESCRTRRDDQPVISYQLQFLPEVDFVYVDGPANACPPDAELLFREKALQYDPKGRLANIDVENLWQHNIFPRVIVIDGRRSTVARLLKTCHEKYTVVLASLYEWQATGIFPRQFLYHTLLVKKSDV